MSKKQKLALTIIGTLIVVLGVFISILNMYARNKPQPIVYPKGNLSDSIFDSQNSIYTPNERYSITHEFSMEPYTVDTIDAERAQIENGSVYASGDAYFFYSDIEKQIRTSDCVKQQFSQVLEYGVDIEECAIEVLLTETGFINGFTAEYQVLHLSVPSVYSQSGSKDAYLVVYRLVIEDEDEYPDNYDIVIGVGTEILSTETLELCKIMLDEDVMTIQYSSKMAKDLISKMDIPEDTSVTEIIDTSEDTETVEETGENEESDTTEDTNDEDAGELVNEEVHDSSYKTMGVLLKQNYKDLTIVVDWTNMEETPSLVFCDVREEFSYTPETTMDGRVVFRVGEIEGGVYMVKIFGWEDAGTFTTTLIENGQEEPANAE